MNTLKMYKNLSQEHKNNLSLYSIYNSIYDIAYNHECNISDNDVERIAELSYRIYLKDEWYDYPRERISDFITECYLKGNASLDAIEDCNRVDILEAIDNDDTDFDFNYGKNKEKVRLNKLQKTSRLLKLKEENNEKEEMER